MTTEWAYRAIIFTSVNDIAFANSMAAIIGVDVGDATMFTNAQTMVNSASAEFKIVVCPLKLTGYQRLTEFSGPGPYPLLNALGITNPTIAQAKAKITLEVGTIEAVMARQDAFLAEHDLTKPVT